MRLPVLLAVLLTACHDEIEKDSGTTGTDSTPTVPGDDTATPTDTDSDTTTWTDTDSTTVPYECGEIPEPPEISATRWTSAGPVTAGTIITIGTAAGGGYPVYAAGSRTGGWRTDDDQMWWIELQLQRYHSYSDLVVHSEDPLRLLHSQGGMLFTSTNGGGSWTQLGLGDPSPNEEGVVELVLGLAARGDEAWAALSTGEVLYSDDFGVAWESRGYLGMTMADGWNYSWRLTPPGPTGETLFFTDGQDLLRSPDGGRNWTPVRPDLISARAVARAPDGRVVVGFNTGYVTSEDDGATWTETGLGTPIAATAFTSSGRIVAAGSGGVYVDGARGGYPPMTPTVLAAVGERLLLGHETGFHISDDDGATWIETTQNMQDEGLSVAMAHPVCPNRLYVASRCTGGVYYSEDWGQTWTHTHDYFHYVMGLHFDPRDPDHIWAVSDDFLTESRDGGATWVELTRAVHFHGFDYHPHNVGRLLLGSVGSGESSDQQMRVYASNDAGLTWEDSSEGLPVTQASAHTIAWLEDDVVLLGTYKAGDMSHQSGEGVGLWRSTDNGASWSQVEALPVVDIAWLEETESGVWAATEDGLWGSTDAGLTWTQADGPTGPLLSVDFVGEVGMAYNTTSSVWRTVDSGATWAVYGELLAPSGGTTLAQVAISADLRRAWTTPYASGIWQIALE